jgi:hypothetical protein
MGHPAAVAVGFADISAAVASFQGKAYPWVALWLANPYTAGPAWCACSDEAKLSADINGDGYIDAADDALAATTPVYFVVNSDDDNGNDQEDYLDDGPAFFEDDLVELRLSAKCPPLDLATAWWSLSWVEPDPQNPALKVWTSYDKSDGWFGPGTPIANGEPNLSWPPLPSVWLEGVRSFDVIQVTLTVIDNSSPTVVAGPGVGVTFARIYAAAPCTPAPSPGERFWLGATKSGTNITGASAYITSDWQLMDPLCGPPGARLGALSAIYVSTKVTLSGGPSGSYDIWVQIGAARERRTGSPFTTSDYYAESYYGPDQDCSDGVCDKDIETVPEALTGDHRYQFIHVYPDIGRWQYYFDSLPFHSFQHNIWKYLGGVTLVWDAEIGNLEDHLCGTPSTPCIFSDCYYSVDWGTGQPANIVEADIGFVPTTPGRSEWDYHWISSTSFEVWDKHP